MRDSISEKIIIIIIRIIICSSCGNCCHCLLLMDDFIGIQKYIGGHDIDSLLYKSIIVPTESMYISHVQCALRYMCTFVRTSERDRWRERNLSSLSFFLLLLLFLFLSLALPLPLSFTSGEEKSLKFSLVRTHTCTACCSLAYILTIDSTSSYEISESKSQTSREDDGNDNREKKRNGE